MLEELLPRRSDGYQLPREGYGGVLEVVVGRIQPLWCGGEKGATGKGCLVGWFERVHHRPPRKLLPPSTTSPLDWNRKVVKGRKEAGGRVRMCFLTDVRNLDVCTAVV